MSEDYQKSEVRNVLPPEAWNILLKDQEALLIDVRTSAEWAWVGFPDLTSLEKEVFFVSWVLFPSMDPNPNFIQDVMSRQKNTENPMVFICRSGVRSYHAAAAMMTAGYSRCFNVAHGFEGDLDQAGHRGRLNGWKVDGLPWKQQ